MRPIDADALQLAIVDAGQANEGNRYKIGDVWELNGAEIRAVIDAQPTFETIKRGRWIKTYECYPISGRCSSCGWNASYTQSDVVGYPYCPYCGAKMINGDEQDNPSGS